MLSDNEIAKYTRLKEAWAKEGRWVGQNSEDGGFEPDRDWQEAAACVSALLVHIKELQAMLEEADAVIAWERGNYKEFVAVNTVAQFIQDDETPTDVSERLIREAIARHRARQSPAHGESK